jgi:hypothetical protein
MNLPICLPLVDGDTFVIDNSSIEGFQTCPRASQYTISRRLRPSGDRVPLRFGGIVHRVLETRYRFGNPLFEQTEDVTNAMLAVASEEFTKWTPPEEDYRTYDTTCRLIQKYGATYPYESFTIPTINDRPAIEIPFALHLGNLTINAEIWVQPLTRLPNGALVTAGDPVLRPVKTIRVLWSGKIDMIYHDTGGTYILDHKTSSIATNMAEFELSHQFSGYVWAAEQLLSTIVSGICINRMVVRKPTRTGDPFTFERKLIPVSRFHIVEWSTDMLYIISDFIEMVRRGYLPKHTAWCVGKFGTCPFHRVCTLPSDEQRELVLTSGEYEPNTWTPLAHE